MKKQLITCLAILLTFVACKKKNKELEPTFNDNINSPTFYQDFATFRLPAAGNGKKWVVDPNFTDEFSRATLDANKWNNQISTWVGRAPGFFVANNVSQENGNLVLTNTWLQQPIQSGGKTFTIGCAAVASKNSDLRFPCYTEVSMKASNVSLSSTFWLMSTANLRYPSTSNCQFTYNTELDVVETVGGDYNYDKSIQNFNTKLKSNTHFRTRPCGGGDEIFHTSEPIALPLGYTTHSGFHRYGVYWIDANSCKIYNDGKLMYTVKFNDSQKTDPFDLNMGLRMVTESYDWLKPPTKAILEAAATTGANKTMYDYVRTYRLVNK